jgi:hypothetical protein
LAGGGSESIQGIPINTEALHDFGTQNSEAHHADYDKPLDVDFLCQRHHLQFHARLNKEFLQRNRRRYSLAFHNQVLSEFRREYLQPELPL